MDDIEKWSRCRVCGWLFPGPVWEDDGTDPTYDICPSCGCEAGNDDYTLESTRQYRQEWIDSGMKWWSPIPKKQPPNPILYPNPLDYFPPPNWDPIEQMTHIPEEYR